MKSQSTALLSFFTLALLQLDETSASIYCDIDPVDQDFLTNAPWVITSSVDLPVSVDDCWNIITDDDSYKFWYPELTDFDNINTPGQVGSIRTVKFDDCVLNALALGAVSLEEEFDVWVDTGNTRSFQFFFTGATRPPFYSFEGGREEFLCDSLGDSKSRFSLTAAFAPGIITQGLGFIVRPRLERIITELSPERMLEAISNGDLPITSKATGGSNSTRARHHIRG